MFFPLGSVSLLKYSDYKLPRPGRCGQPKQKKSYHSALATSCPLCLTVGAEIETHRLSEEMGSQKAVGPPVLNATSQRTGLPSTHSVQVAAVGAGGHMTKMLSKTSRLPWGREVGKETGVGMLGSARSGARGEDGLPAWLGRIRKGFGGEEEF